MTYILTKITFFLGTPLPSLILLIYIMLFKDFTLRWLGTCLTAIKYNTVLICLISEKKNMKVLLAGFCAYLNKIQNLNLQQLPPHHCKSCYYLGYVLRPYLNFQSQAIHSLDHYLMYYYHWYFNLGPKVFRRHLQSD